MPNDHLFARSIIDCIITFALEEKRAKVIDDTTRYYFTDREVAYGYDYERAMDVLHALEALNLIRSHGCDAHMIAQFLVGVTDGAVGNYSISRRAAGMLKGLLKGSSYRVYF